MRKQIRVVNESPKVIFDTFSKGMEFNHHSKDAMNPRTQFIKNMEIDSDGKLSVRRPMIPVVHGADINSRFTLPDGYSLIKVLYSPFSTIESPYIWAISKSTANHKSVSFVYLYRQGTKLNQVQLNDVFTTNNSGTFEYVFIPGEDRLLVNSDDGLVEFRFEGNNLINEKPLEYIPNDAEIAESGINLYGDDVYFLSNLILPGSRNRINIPTLMPYKLIDFSRDYKEAEVSPNTFQYDIAPVPADQMILKARLEIPFNILKKEFNSFFTIVNENGVPTVRLNDFTSTVFSTYPSVGSTEKNGALTWQEVWDSVTEHKVPILSGGNFDGQAADIDKFPYVAMPEFVWSKLDSGRSMKKFPLFLTLANDFAAQAEIEQLAVVDPTFMQEARQALAGSSVDWDKLTIDWVDTFNKFITHDATTGTITKMLTSSARMDTLPLEFPANDGIDYGLTIRYDSAAQVLTQGSKVISFKDAVKPDSIEIDGLKGTGVAGDSAFSDPSANLNLNSVVDAFDPQSNKLVSFGYVPTAKLAIPYGHTQFSNFEASDLQREQFATITFALNDAIRKDETVTGIVVDTVRMRDDFDPNYSVEYKIDPKNDGNTSGSISNQVWPGSLYRTLEGYSGMSTSGNDTGHNTGFLVSPMSAKGGR